MSLRTLFISTKNRANLRKAVISRIEDHFLAIDLETIESLSRQLDHRSDCYFTLGGGLVEQLLAEGEAAFSALDRGMRVSNEITSNEDAMEFYDGVESAYTDATAVDDDFEESDDFEDYATRGDEQRYEDQFSAGVEFAEHFSRQHDRNSMLEMAGEVSPHQYFLDGVRYVIDTASQN